MIIAVPVTPAGDVDPRWGRAHRVALARLEGGEIKDWREHEVAWDESHDAGTHGSHHARIVRFLREEGVHAVVLHHCGGPMANTMTKLGLVLVWEASGDARAAVLAAAPLIRDELAARQSSAPPA